MIRYLLQSFSLCCPSALALALVLTATQASAFDLDSDQPIQVESDQARLDDQAGTATYTGNVEVVQGKRRLKADKVVLQRSNGEIESMQATGEPATYSQPQTTEDPEFYGEGEWIHYSAGKNRITLKREALVRQASDTFSGNRIRYDLDKRVVTAQSARDDESDRVRMTIQPGRERNTDDSN